MKKKSGSRIVRVLSRIFQVRTWFDWERVKGFTLYLGNGIKRLFIPQQVTKVESFDAAMTRLRISNADLLLKQKALFRLSMVMVCAASLILIYAGYHLYHGAYKATIISLVVMLIALVLAFRYHFWYFQIKQRKLGCSFQEWFQHGLMGEKND